MLLLRHIGRLFMNSLEYNFLYMERELNNAMDELKQQLLHVPIYEVKSTGGHDCTAQKLAIGRVEMALAKMKDSLYVIGDPKYNSIVYA